MKIQNTFWVAFLSLLLSFSIALPFCCHTPISQISEHNGHNKKAHSTHEQHSDGQQCNCGHTLAKDYQKVKNIVINDVEGLSSTVTFLRGASHLSFYIEPIFIRLQKDFLKNTSPPLHLLFSVFLN